MKFKVEKSDAEWRAELDAESYRVTRGCGTETPFTGKYYHHKEDGIYRCIACGKALFDARAKYESGSGWPSYFEPYDQDAVVEITDTSHGMARTEVRCGDCGAHLGHVFNDGPAPTGLRYCINSVALDFEARDSATQG
ncbi:MAG: peptide-methionine (R)-S-oxide reductase MsrB [Bradymonadaceae bacterium]|nr:peptide-methionine (R)-S-oxide reductase MsrB [Lujinxingiaceae bacterium]